MIALLIVIGLVAFEVLATRLICSDLVTPIFGPAWKPTPEEFEARLASYR